MAQDRRFFGLKIRGLEAPFGNGLEAHWTHWLEASVTGSHAEQAGAEDGGVLEEFGDDFVLWAAVQS